MERANKGMATAATIPITTTVINNSTTVTAGAHLRPIRPHTLTSTMPRGLEIARRVHSALIDGDRIRRVPCRSPGASSDSFSGGRDGKSCGRGGGGRDCVREIVFHRGVRWDPGH